VPPGKALWIPLSVFIVIFGFIARGAAPAVSPRMRALIEGDPRRSYYPFMIALLVAISVILHLAVPVTLVQSSANMSNPGALIYPFLLIYPTAR
jgi:hypothetical protein